MEWNLCGWRNGWIIPTSTDSGSSCRTNLSGYYSTTRLECCCLLMESKHHYFHFIRRRMESVISVLWVMNLREKIPRNWNKLRYPIEATFCIMNSFNSEKRINSKTEFLFSFLKKENVSFGYFDWSFLRLSKLTCVMCVSWENILWSLVFQHMLQKYPESFLFKLCLARRISWINFFTVTGFI